MRDFDKTAVGAQTMSAKLYAIMVGTTALTFTTLLTGHQLLFPPQSLFA